MGAQDRGTEPGLIERLLREPWRFSFFQVVQMLEKSRRGATSVGGAERVEEEVLRFRPALSLAFPSADVQSVETVSDPAGPERYRVEVNFLGLYGPSSPLPNYFTEDMMRDDEETSLVRGFLDLFHHRFLSLFYRCWSKYRHHVQYRPGGEDGFSRCLFGLAGLGLVRPKSIPGLDPVRLLRYAGLLTHAPTSAETLEAALGDLVTEGDVAVLPFVGRWVKIPDEQRNRLGMRRCTLGSDLHAGEEVLDRAGMFRVRVGPVPLEGFANLLPGEDRASAIDEMIRLLVRDPLGYEVEVRLHRDDVPDLRLEEGEMGNRLGQTTWFGRPAENPGVLFQEPYGA